MPCVIFVVWHYGYLGKGRLSKYSPSTFLLLSAPAQDTQEDVLFLLWVVSAFHFFPGVAFLKHLECVPLACICKVHVICLALCFQKEFLLDLLTDSICAQKTQHMTAEIHAPTHVAALYTLCMCTHSVMPLPGFVSLC